MKTISLEEACRLLGLAHEITVEESGEPSFEKVLIPSPRDGVFLRLRGNSCGFQFRTEDNPVVEVEGTAMILMDNWMHAVRLVLLVPMRFEELPAVRLMRDTLEYVLTHHHEGAGEFEDKVLAAIAAGKDKTV